MADPPGGIGRKLEALAGIEFLHSPHETKVPLLKEVEKRQTATPVLLGHGNDQPEIGPCQAVPGTVTASLEPLQGGQLRPVRPTQIASCRQVCQAPLRFVPIPDAVSQLHLFAGGQQGDLSDLTEVQAGRISDPSGIGHGLWTNPVLGLAGPR